MPWGKGYAWFEGPSFEPTPEALADRGTIMQRCDQLSAFLAAAPAYFGTDPTRTVMLGFSQGGAMVWSTLALKGGPLRCGVICSGFLHPDLLDGSTALGKAAQPMSISDVSKVLLDD